MEKLKTHQLLKGELLQQLFKIYRYLRKVSSQNQLTKYGQFFVAEVVAVKLYIYLQKSIYTNCILISYGIIL